MEEQGADHQGISIWPLSLSVRGVSILSVALLGIGFLGYWLNPVLAACLPLFIVFCIFSAFKHRYPLAVGLLFNKAEWGGEAGSYLGVFNSRLGTNGHRRRSWTSVVRLGEKVEGETIFKFGGAVYAIRERRACRLAEIDVVKFVAGLGGSGHLADGLNGEGLQRSRSLFGEGDNWLQRCFLKLGIRHFWEHSGWVVLLLATLILAGLIDRRTLVVHLAFDLVSLGLMVWIVRWEAGDFKEIYGALGSIRYKVVRQGETKMVGLWNLLIGDVVCGGGEEEKPSALVFYFRSVLVGKKELVVREGSESIQKFKVPFKEMGALADANKRKRNVVLPGSRVQIGQWNGAERLLVTERSLNRYFERWFDRPLRQQYVPLTERFSVSAMKLFVVGGLVLVILYFVLSLYFKRPKFPVWAGLAVIKGALSVVVLIVPAMFLLTEWMQLRSRTVLKSESVTIFGRGYQNSALCSKLFLDFSELMQLQFAEIVYKNKILGFQTDQFQPNEVTIQSGSTYESLLIVVLYLSLGEFQEKNTFLRQVYDRYRDYFEYRDSLGQFKDVVHKQTEKVWSVQRVFKQDEKGMRSWVIEYDRRSYFLIAETSEEGQALMSRLGANQDENKKASYEAAADHLRLEGRQLKTMLFRNLKEGQLRGTRSRDVDYNNDPREALEQNFQFGHFLVFDNALHKETVETISQLREVKNNKGQPVLGITFFFHGGRSSLEGFEHILTGIPFLYNCEGARRMRELRKGMGGEGCMFKGSGCEDEGLLGGADVGVQVMREGRLVMPSDVVVENVQGLVRLLERSRGMLEAQLELLRLGFVVAAWQMFGAIFLERSEEALKVAHQQLWAMLGMGAFMLLPIMGRSLVVDKTIIKDHLQPLVLCNLNFFMLLLTAVIGGLGILLIAARRRVCPVVMVRLRGVHDPFCLNLPLTLGGWAGLLGFYVIYGEFNFGWRRQEWGRLLLLPFWGAVLFFGGVPVLLILQMVAVLIFLLVLKAVVRYASSRS